MINVASLFSSTCIIYIPRERGKNSFQLKNQPLLWIKMRFSSLFFLFFFFFQKSGKKGFSIWFSDMEIIWCNSEYDLLLSLISTMSNFHCRLQQHFQTPVRLFGRRAHNNRYSWPKIAWEEKTGMETTQTNPINRTNSRNKEQSPHTQLLATINEWFPSVSIYLVFRKIPKIPVKNIFRGQERRGVTSMSIEDFSQGRDVGAKRFCRIRLLKSR